jgi:hypothetical protein
VNSFYLVYALETRVVHPLRFALPSIPAFPLAIGPPSLLVQLHLQFLDRIIQCMIKFLLLLLQPSSFALVLVAAQAEAQLFAGFFLWLLQLPPPLQPNPQVRTLRIV